MTIRGISNRDRKHAGNRKQCGRRWPVGNERLTLKQISELTGKSTGFCHTALDTETAEHFIKRIKNSKGIQ